MIIAKTIKGKYIEETEDKLDWHGKPYLNAAWLEKAKNSLKESNV